MIFNIGPLEFILIMLVAIIVLGPERMVSGARTFGRWIYKLVRSPTWRAIMTTSQEIRDLPNKIVRESGIEETMKEMQSVGTDLNDEINQAVKEVNNEVSQAASAVSAEVSQAVKDVNAELKQTAQAASEAAAKASAEANQAIQPAAGEDQPTVVETPVLPASEEAPQTEAVAPTEVGGYDQAPVPVEEPVAVLQETSVVEPVALSNNGHSQETPPDAVAQAGPAPEVSNDSEEFQEPVILRVPKVRKAPKAPKTTKAVPPPEEEISIQPPESPAAHIKIE
jgi:sec-independent protein translocase protein TatB